MALHLDNPYWQQLAQEHRVWLDPFDARHLKNWEKMLKADSEAALCEACVRRWLQSMGVTVEPGEKLTGKCGGPDFRCSIHRKHFYVEVACISMETACEKIGFTDLPLRGLTPFDVHGMLLAAFEKARGKTPQCANLDGPALVIIGTFHTDAAALGFSKLLITDLLTGKTELSWKMDPETGEHVGPTYLGTQLEGAAFLKPDPIQIIAYARYPISGLLVGGLAMQHYLGVLHPTPVRRFDPSLLPSVDFAEVQIDCQAAQFRVHWRETSAGK